MLKISGTVLITTLLGISCIAAPEEDALWLDDPPMTPTVGDKHHGIWVSISGNFEILLYRNANCSNTSSISADLDFHSSLYSVKTNDKYPLENVNWINQSKLEAKVPMGLPEGRYHLLVIDPRGNTVWGTNAYESTLDALDQDAGTETSMDGSPEGDTETETDSFLGNGYQCKNRITVDHTQVSEIEGANLVSFPLLVHIADEPDLKGIAYGGCLENEDGSDILFLDEDGTRRLVHQIEEYDVATGELIVWVKIPYLAHDKDTVIHLYHGNREQNPPNASISSTDVWNSRFKAVYHLNNGGGSNTVRDSTQNMNGLFIALSGGGEEVVGKIGKGYNFRQGKYLDKGYRTTLSASENLTITNNLSLECWIKPNNYTNQPASLISKRIQATESTNYELLLDSLGNVSYSDSSVTSGTHKPPLGEWTYIALVVEDSKSVASVYINGDFYEQLESSSTGSGKISYLWIGGFWTTLLSDEPQGGFDGMMDEVRISGVAHPADWIKTTYNNQNDPSSFITVE